MEQLATIHKSNKKKLAVVGRRWLKMAEIKKSPSPHHQQGAKKRYRYRLYTANIVILKKKACPIEQALKMIIC